MAKVKNHPVKSEQYEVYFNVGFGLQSEVVHLYNKRQHIKAEKFIKNKYQKPPFNYRKIEIIKVVYL